MTWDPEQYLAYQDLRLRPALELLGRVPNERAEVVVDLGCGPGNVTPWLAGRWPDAEVIGVDDSAEMLARARRDHPGLETTWVQHEAATWEPDRPVDVIFSNALLHWLDEHERLVPRLLDLLVPGRGTLAFQVPDNYREPSHREAYALARDPRWADRLVPLLRERPILAPQAYARLLAPLVSHLDVWTTTYLQPMQGRDPVAEWTRGSLLRPLLAELTDEEAAAFDAGYRERLRAAYPSEPDGTTWFPFTRLFVVATRSTRGNAPT
ncbi:MAG TPA: methyltransferase domain-containing protein [Nitriliruptorales bacterium]